MIPIRLTVLSLAIVATSSKIMEKFDSSSKYCGLHDKTGTCGGATERRGRGVSARVVAGGPDRPARPGRGFAGRAGHVAERVHRADAIVRGVRMKTEDVRLGIHLCADTVQHFVV